MTAARLRFWLILEVAGTESMPSLLSDDGTDETVRSLAPRAIMARHLRANLKNRQGTGGTAGRRCQELRWRCCAHAR